LGVLPAVLEPGIDREESHNVAARQQGLIVDPSGDSCGRNILREQFDESRMERVRPGAEGIAYEVGIRLLVPWRLESPIPGACHRGIYSIMDVFVVKICHSLLPLAFTGTPRRKILTQLAWPATAKASSDS
jgi:hypothetical protein